MRAIFMMLIGWCCSIFYKEKGLWLFCERGTDARDNGMWMFKYVKEKHPEINAKYIISKASEDRDRLKQWENDLIDYESFKHYILLWKAKNCISTHVCGCYPYYFSKSIFFRHFLSKRVNSKNIFLQHGIIKDDIKRLHYGYDKIDLFICGAKKEFDYIKKNYGYPEGIVKYTGLARFDNLRKRVNDKRLILIMPTWRYWLHNEIFIESDYFLKYKKLLCDTKLHNVLKENNVSLIFYPHYEVQKYIAEFKNLQLPSSVIIADKRNYDVQQLLIESALLVTDYSSVYFDFVYMEKPVLYYQFDEKRYRKEQYQDGYYDYHDGLGEWTDNDTALILKMEEYIKNNFEIPVKYKSKIEDFFPLRDEENRQRIFNEI